jgi:hypothetical protein
MKVKKIKNIGEKIHNHPKDNDLCSENTQVALYEHVT